MTSSSALAAMSFATCVMLLSDAAQAVVITITDTAKNERITFSRNPIIPNNRPNINQATETLSYTEKGFNLHPPATAIIRLNLTDPDAKTISDTVQISLIPENLVPGQPATSTLKIDFKSDVEGEQVQPLGNLAQVESDKGNIAADIDCTNKPCQVKAGSLLGEDGKPLLGSDNKPLTIIDGSASLQVKVFSDTVREVPEPSSLLMVTLSLGVLGYTHLRRRRV